MRPDRASFLRSSVVALSAIVAVIVIVSAVALILTGENQREFIRLYHTRIHLQQAYSAIIDQETGVRGYVATGDRLFLEPYARASQTIGTRFAILDEDAANRKYADDVRRIQLWHAEWLQTVAMPLLAHPKRPNALAIQLHGKRIMDAIRTRATDVRVDLDADVDADIRSTTAITYSAVGLRVFLILLFVLLAVRLERERFASLRRLQEDLAERNEALERSNQSLQEFAYVASHDLQEPLRAVARFTQLLKKRYAGKLDAEGDEYLSIAADGALRMQSLIKDILEYSRVSTHKRELAVVGLATPVAQAVATLQSVIQDAGAQVVVAPSMPTVRGDVVQLTQLFQNLIGNAIKYNASKTPVVRISAERSDADWVISVADNGIGISPENYERIFGVFQRLHTREEHEGTGIGLALAKRILERHGGRIWLDSAEEGTTFHFTLPILQGAR